MEVNGTLGGQENRWWGRGNTVSVEEKWRSRRSSGRKI